MIKIKENEKPNLKKCEMVCDKPLHKKLDNYELTKFLNGHTTNLILGRPASGKSSILYSLFKSPKCLKKVFNKVFIFRPERSGASMKDDIFDKLPDEQKYYELNLENLENCMNQIEAMESDENSCIIMDDVTSNLKDKILEKKFRELVFNRRHLHTSIFFLVQTWKSIPRDIRKMFSNLFIFKCSKAEINDVFDEVFETQKDKFVDIMKICYDKKHNFMFLNTDSGRVFKNWDELIFEEEDDENNSVNKIEK